MHFIYFIEFGCKSPASSTGLGIGLQVTEDVSAWLDVVSLRRYQPIQDASDTGSRIAEAGWSIAQVNSLY